MLCDFQLKTLTVHPEISCSNKFPGDFHVGCTVWIEVFGEYLGEFTNLQKLRMWKEGRCEEEGGGRY